MAPHGVARLKALLVGDPLPLRRGLAHALGAQLQAKQVLERQLGGAAYRTLAAHHFTQLVEMRQMRHAGAPHRAVDPAFDKREQGLDRPQRLTLLRGVGDADVRQIDRSRKRFGIERRSVAQLLLHRVEVDRDAARVLADERGESRHEPRHRRVEARVRLFSQREKLGDFGCVEFE